VDDETKKRTTSFAKSIEGLFKPDSALDNLSPNVREAFNHAADQIMQQTERPQEQERQTDERQAVHAPRPSLDLKPRGQIRRTMDRTIDYEKLRAINTAAKRRGAAARSRSMSRDFEQER